jgi:ATP-dependent DNA helicase RecG
MGTLVQMPRNPIDQLNDRLNSLQLTENEIKIYYFIREFDHADDQINDQLTTNYIASKLGLSYSTIQRILRVLKQKYMVQRVGSKKTGYWQIKD